MYRVEPINEFLILFPATDKNPAPQPWHGCVRGDRIEVRGGAGHTALPEGNPGTLLGFVRGRDAGEFTITDRQMIALLASGQTPLVGDLFPIVEFQHGTFMHKRPVARIKAGERHHDSSTA